MHGTTVATNAVLEGRGASVGLVVNEGFRYLLHLARAWTPGPLFGWMVYERPAPLAAVDPLARSAAAWTPAARRPRRSTRRASRRRCASSWPGRRGDHGLPAELVRQPGPRAGRRPGGRGDVGDVPVFLSSDVSPSSASTSAPSRRG